MAMAMEEEEEEGSMTSSSSSRITSCLKEYRGAREAFKRGVTRPLEWRLRQLDAMASCLREREADINQALYEDLGKSSFESFCTEVYTHANDLSLQY